MTKDCGLVDSIISASDKDLPVPEVLTNLFFITLSKNVSYPRIEHIFTEFDVAKIASNL